jgi:hypothetical protein
LAIGDMMQERGRQFAKIYYDPRQKDATDFSSDPEPT